jgi:molybdopterin adenylyltransferase
MEILVCTVSDRAARGEYEDRSGPRIVELLRELLPEAQISRAVVSDDPEELHEALSQEGFAAILTTGGTGLGPRDRTPEVTVALCDRPVPGIAELLRAESLKETPNAALSRGQAGLRGSTLIVNLPGSVKAAAFCTRILAPLLPHALAMIRGGNHAYDRSQGPPH